MVWAISPSNITVLMSVYNDESYVSEAIESILCQTLNDFEFLIVIDGSTDRSPEIIRSYDDPRICLIDNPENMGLTKSLNRGLALAKGELIARFDSNDVACRDRLERQVEFMDANPEVALVGTQAEKIDVHGHQLPHLDLDTKPTTPLGIEWYLMFGTPFVHSSVMFRKSVVWEELGGYNEDFKVAQDAELFSRIGSRYRVANLHEVLTYYRIDASSVSRDLSALIREGHRERMERLFESNMARVLQTPSIPSTWIQTALFHNNLIQVTSQEMALRLLTSVEAMYTRFLEVHPEAKENKEIESHIALTGFSIAYNLAAHCRSASLGLFFRRFVRYPRVGVQFLPRYLSLLAAGESIRRLYRRLRYQR